MAISEGELRSLHSEKSDELRRIIKQKDAILENYKREHGRLELFFEDLKAQITPVDPPKIVFKDVGNDTIYHAVMQISDVHMGSVQEFDEIEGFNQYNSEIAFQRCLLFSNSVLEWIKRKRQSYRINDLSVLVTGDLISGDIHDELRVTNEFPVTVQIIKAAELLTQQITMLSPYFNNITVEYIGADNHGRLTRKPQAKEEGLNNYNYVVGYIASIHLSRLSNVQFNLYPLHEKVVRCLTRQYLITHGHGIQGWMGIPWYGIERRQNKEARARLSMIMEATDNELRMMRQIGFHKYVFGHYHYPIDTPQYSGAASTQGTDAYDHKNGRHADPSQPAWLIHPKKGEFDRTNFNLK